MTDKDLTQITTSLYKLVYLLRTGLFPGDPDAVQKKRVVVNYDPYYEVVELPVVIVENVMLSRNLFRRQVGYEDPIKDMVPVPPEYTQRKLPLFLDMRFNVVVITDKVHETMPLYERLLAFIEANKYIIVGAEDDYNDPKNEPYESYEYDLEFMNGVGRSFFQKDHDHMNQMTLQGVIKAVRVYPGVELVGKLISGRYFRLYTMDGETLLDEFEGPEVSGLPAPESYLTDENGDRLLLEDEALLVLE